jgi:hypothetical protein
MADTSSWEVVYKHLVLIESHWTAQIQNQQQRNGAILTVTGFLLGFSGFTGANALTKLGDEGAIVWFKIGTGALAAALLVGMVAMWPAVRLRKGRTWLQAYPTFDLGAQDSDRAYQALAVSLADEIDDDKHGDKLLWRRRFMFIELLLVTAGLIALGVCMFLYLNSPGPGVLGRQ